MREGLTSERLRCGCLRPVRLWRWAHCIGLCATTWRLRSTAQLDRPQCRHALQFANGAPATLDIHAVSKIKARRCISNSPDAAV